MKKLKQTERKKIKSDIWYFVLGYYNDNGYMPTYEEIGENSGHSKQWAMLWLRELEKDGKIKIDKGRYRAIRLVTKKSKSK